MNSLWLSTANSKNYETLYTSLNADVCIIGAGIFGLSCAYYLSKAGLKVIVLEKDSIGEKTTGHTTGKITSAHGLFYNYLVNNFNETFAHDYLFANEEAISNIKNIIDTENIKCDFEYKSNFIYTTNKSEVNQIKAEVETVNYLGFPANFATKTGLPFEIAGAIQYKNQAQFNVISYLNGLCKAILNNSGKIFTHSTVIDVKNTGSSYITSTLEGNVESKFFVLASHFPFLNFPGMYFTKMYQSSSYIIGIDSKKTLFNGMYISASSPIYSFRTAKYNGRNILLIGGSEHKTGTVVNYNETYGALEKYAKQLYPNCEILFRWDTRDCITLDKVPYIGPFSNAMENIYIGTGFKKWGMTTSNVAANIITDYILGNENKYTYLFDSTRMQPIKNRVEFKNILTESVNSLVLNKFKTPKLTFDNISNNSGGIIEVNNQKVGIYKDTSGNIFAVKPVCSHLGCLLSWNDADKTWDCPCHGSRFDYMGKNLYDPAIKDLEKYNL